MTTVIIGGDIYPTGNIEKAFIEGNADEIFHDLLDDIVSADLSIANLESPLISHAMPIAKSGPVLSADIKCTQGLVAAKWNILNLANNHSFDHGAEGLMETIHAIEIAGLGVIGAGLTIQEARKPFVKNINGVRIVIYAMAEHEFSVADQMTPGANPFDIINFVTTIRRYKQQGIFIVLLHGGKEYYPYPTPEMVRQCRFMVDMGADAVICCHTHCPLPWEIYAERPIVYGLGNLIFEPLRKPPASFYEGYLARLTVTEGHVNFEAIPYFQTQPSSGAQKMDKASRSRFCAEMENKSNQLKDPVFIENEWVNYCRQKEYPYITSLFGYNRIMRKLHRFLLPLLHSKEEMQRALLLVQCETHREMLITILKNKRD